MTHQGPLTRGMVKNLQQNLEDSPPKGQVLFACFEWKPRAQSDDPEWPKPAQGEGYKKSKQREISNNVFAFTFPHMYFVHLLEYDTFSILCHVDWDPHIMAFISTVQG
ncbi:hypothetical protein LR48_Vigan05g128200 [Vigna angularis]|uniref:Uncharacterized protein n=1 Tax=Phaseolus angularis TaxID=3914 RepID=A0A0L9UM84_PHAAN|nr:hypothetical protein LR48_Vigan05g128200 [Vigna angularis]